MHIASYLVKSAQISLYWTFTLGSFNIFRSPTTAIKTNFHEIFKNKLVLIRLERTCWGEKTCVKLFRAQVFVTVGDRCETSKGCHFKAGLFFRVSTFFLLRQPFPSPQRWHSWQSIPDRNWPVLSVTGWGCSIIHIPLKLPIGEKKKKKRLSGAVIFSSVLPSSGFLAAYSSALLCLLPSTSPLICRSGVMLELSYFCEIQFSFGASSGRVWF